MVRERTANAGVAVHDLNLFGVADIVVEIHGIVYFDASAHCVEYWVVDHTRSTQGIMAGIDEVVGFGDLLAAQYEAALIGERCGERHDGMVDSDTARVDAGSRAHIHNAA